MDDVSSILYGLILIKLSFPFLEEQARDSDRLVTVTVCEQSNRAAVQNTDQV